jgi:hypothetical protein
MKTLFEKDGVKIKSILAGNKKCDECYFGEERKKGQWWCKDENYEWNIPDCVMDYPYGKSRIYVLLTPHK